MKELTNYINGEQISALSGGYIDNFNPATGQLLCRLPDSGSREVQRAVDAAEKAFPGWSATPVEERSKCINKIANLLEKDLDRIAKAETDDTGKPLWLSTSIDIPRSIRNLRFFASAAMQFTGDFHQTDLTAIKYTHRKPVGIIGCISPWNLPLYLFTWKIAPALAAGNCVIAKPSEMTPLTAYELGKICQKAGLPPGVLNIIHGVGNKVGSAIVEHKKIKAISFTGGTDTGRKIAATAGPMFKKLSLEMGGKNPTILFEDCDTDKAINNAIRAAFTNQGEICLCGSRIFVHESIYEIVKLGFINALNNWETGDPLDENSRSGALISAEHKQKVMDYIALAREEGGEIIAGGRDIQPKGRCENGFFVEPTLIEGLPQNCRVNREEIFGPVATLIPFETEEEVIKMANDTQYGLSASIWTESLQRAHRVAAAVDAGIVWVNCWMLRDLRTPFGGTKNSGIGREGGFEALKFVTESRNICIKLEN